MAKFLNFEDVLNTGGVLRTFLSLRFHGKSLLNSWKLLQLDLNLASTKLCISYRPSGDPTWSGCEDPTWSGCGIPTWPVLANIFEGFYETKLCSNVNKPHMYHRYICSV